MLSHTKKSRKRNPRKKNAKKQNIKINSPEQKTTQTVIINNPAPKKRQSKKTQDIMPSQRPMQYPIMPFPVGGSQPVIVNNTPSPAYPQFSSIAEQLKEQQAKIQKDMETFYNVHQQASRENDSRLLGIEQQIKNSQQELARRLATGSSEPGGGGSMAQPAFGGLQEDLDQLQQQWESQFTGQDERFREIEDRVRANTEQQSAFQSQVQPFFQETDDRIKALSDYGRQIKALSDYGRQTQELVDQSEKMRIADIEQVNEQRMALEEKLARLEESRDSILQKLETEDNPTKIQKLEERLDQITENIDEFQKEIIEDLDSFNTRIESLEEAPQEASFQTPTPGSSTSIFSPMTPDQQEQERQQVRDIAPELVDLENEEKRQVIIDLVKKLGITADNKAFEDMFAGKQKNKGKVQQLNSTAFRNSASMLASWYRKLKEYEAMQAPDPEDDIPSGLANLAFVNEASPVNPKEKKKAKEPEPQYKEIEHKGETYIIDEGNVYTKTEKGKKGELYGTLTAAGKVKKNRQSQ